MGSRDDHPTPGPLDALESTDGQSVSKIDLLLGYVRGLVAQNKAVLTRLEGGDRRLDDHARDIEDLKRRIGRKIKPEPHWLWRAAAIAAITAITTAIVTFALKGGFSLGLAS